MIIGKKQSDSLILSLVYNNRELYRLDTKNYTEEISIGRDYACTWSVGQMDQTASSRHAMISFRKGDFYITDLSSRNGIFLNGNQIKESKLCAGFVFRIGECFLNVSKSDVKSQKKVKPDQIRYRDMRGKVVSYMLIGGTVQIGSAPDCEIRFSDDLISAHHASINKRADGSCWIRDLKSRNGTYVNHQELTSSSERMLKDNDLISIADVDMTFWDGRVVHESFRFVYALLTLVVTVILCVVGYMVYQQFRPVSVYFIQSARTEARNGDFVKAKQYLTEAKEAKNASDMTNEIRALSKKVDVWERSQDNWNKIVVQIKKGALYEIPELIGNLNLTNISAWDWNESNAPSNISRAKILNEVFKNLLEVDALRRNPEGSVLDLRIQKNELRFSLEKMEKLKDPDFEVLIKFCHELITGTEQCITNYDFAVQEFNKIQNDNFDIKSLIKWLNEMKTQVDPILRFRFEKHLSLLYSLERIKFLIHEKKRLIQNMSFTECQQIAIEYPLMGDTFPSVEKYLQQLMNEEKSMNRFAVQSKMAFDSLAEFGVKLNEEILPLKSLQDDKVMSQVFSCDSLGYPYPSFKREKPCGEYDRVLGIEYFFSVLREIGSKNMVRKAGQMSFNSNLEQLEKIFGQVENFMKFVSFPENKKMVERTGKYAEWLKFLKNQMEYRGKVIQNMKRRLEKYSPDTREYFICQGILYVLDSSYFPEQKYREIKLYFSRYRERIQRLGDRYMEVLPQDAIGVRQEILRYGLPGDSTVKKMWVQN